MVNKNQVIFYLWSTICVLFTATRWGHKDIVEILLSKVADVDVTNNDGKTALHCGE